MKTKTIYMNRWTEANGRKKQRPTDTWYLDFCNRLLPFMEQSSLFAGDSATQAAIALTLYLHDAVAQSGGWKTFAELYRKLYQRDLPFYATSPAEYMPDEINLEDTALVLWTQLARPASKRPDDYTLFNPNDTALWSLAQQAYGLMDEAFEEAPINDTPSRSDWLMETKWLETPVSTLPHSLPEKVSSLNAHRCLAYSHGRPLLYFADYKALRTFFTEVLQWENSPASLLPELDGHKEFVIFANAKGMLLAHDVAACFRADDNPLYDATRAATESIKLFCQPGACPFDLLKYGMTHGLLPDARFPFAQESGLLQKNWDFVARYYLGEYYEGD